MALDNNEMRYANCMFNKNVKRIYETDFLTGNEVFVRAERAER